MSVPLRNFQCDTVAAMNARLHAARIPVAETVERCLPVLLKVQVEMAALLSLAEPRQRAHSSF